MKIFFNVHSYHRSFQQHSILYVNQENPIETIRRAYFAGPIGNFPNLYDQPFVLKSKKLIEEMGGMTSLVVDRCLTKQQPYLLHMNGEKSHVFNMRRLNQLCLNLDNYRPEPYFFYDYGFIWSLIHCYKMSDRLLADSIFPKIRFLLTQYKSCSSILDKYPDNFAFEIISRLTSFIDILPQFIYNLFRQCLSNCMLRLLENNTRIWTTMIKKYQIGVVNDLSIAYSTLYVFLPEKILIFRFYPHDWDGKIFEYKLPSNTFTSVIYGPTDICFYSSQSILIFQKFDHHFGFYLNFNELIYVNFIFKEELIICLKDTRSIDIWNFLEKTLIEQYLFDSPILECSTIERRMDTVIRVTLETSLTHYLIVTNIQGKISFQLVATLNNKPANYNIFLNFDTDVYYSEGQSHVYLYHFTLPENDRLKKIDNLPLLNRIIYRQSFFTDRYQSVLIWLTTDSIVIFHSCSHYFIISGEYHDIYTRSLLKRTFISCLNRNQSIIDIYELKANEYFHTYRLLVHLQLDEKILHWTCQIRKFLS
jgi:hypothetical protein